MQMQDLESHPLAEKIRLKLGIMDPARPLEIAQIEDCISLCTAAMEDGRAAIAVRLLQRLSEHYPDRPDIARHLGRALRLEQRFAEADQVFRKSVAHNPGDPELLFGLAQTRYELGLPAAELFEQAERALPGNLDIARNHAAAMAAEGDVDGAKRLLTTMIAANPAWLDGHKVLATLCWTYGDDSNFAKSYAAACREQPRNPALWLAWFRTIAQTKDWDASKTILDEAHRQLGETPAIAVCRLFVASESGDDVAAESQLAATAHIQGETINLCRIRHYLRRGQFVEAQNVAIPLLLSCSAPLFWPYLSLAWRLLGDERYVWLDRPDESIQARPVDLTGAELSELAEVVRALHVVKRPYLEQSVRGGTQTDRSLILRNEPILQLARERWMEAIRAYIADLPPLEQGHPLLGVPRNHLLVEGSWSVRLLPLGYNVPHNHPMGWLSTAFYISLPEPAKMGPAPAGHIAFGTPPAELRLDLPAYAHIAPRVGETAIFPSTMWHSTVPFHDGERLALALDIRTPDY